MMLSENKDFMIIPHPKDDSHYAVRLLTDYQGIEYAYLTLNIHEDAENDKAEIKFTYELLSGDFDIITDKQHFENYIGAVVHSLILNVIEADEQEHGNKSGTTDTEASSTE